MIRQPDNQMINGLLRLVPRDDAATVIANEVKQSKKVFNAEYIEEKEVF